MLPMGLAATRNAILKIFWGGFLLLTALYCLLAFLPYTYSSLIKGPPYAWIPWFVRHDPALYWLALGAGVGAYWPLHKPISKLWLFGLQAAVGVYLTAWPVLPSLHSDWRAYLCGLGALALLIPVVALDTVESLCARRRSGPTAQLDYSTAMVVASLVALLWAAGAQGRLYSEAHSLTLGLNALELAAWSVLCHILFAILILSILNLIWLLASKTSRPSVARALLTGLFLFGILWLVLIRFLGNGLSFEGWAAQVFGASFAAALTLLGFSLVLPFLQFHAVRRERPVARGRNLFPLALALAFGLFIVALPALIQGGDWNGVIQHTVALAGWLVLGICAYQIRRPAANYSVATILGVLLLAGVGYKSLQASEIFWGKPLGQTDDDIVRAEESYAVHDASFDLVDDALGNERHEPCGDLCRILRQYTNIANFESQVNVRLVDPLVRTQAERPNVFLFVIDSMRPDYLGAYNPKADFSPNLDAFARDGVVIHQAYTQYAGTSLSEPAIWAGTMLLHDHDFATFPKVNALEKLAQVDGYQMVVSYDTFLRQMLSPSDDLIALDADKLWNQVEVCSTIRQAEQALERNSNRLRPIFFYSQPMNVHQFAHNDLPRMTAANWQARPGFVKRITYEVHQVDACMGGFFAYLKQQNLYDNSIIIVASDHGDATGEYGRYSHSLSIYPEVIRVPLIIHLPKSMREALVYDDRRVSTLTDIAPSLYYLLGHRPVIANAMFGRPLFMHSQAELDSYHRDELLVASDERAVYGILADNGRYLYATYDSPAKSYLYDLAEDPVGLHDVLTPALKKDYDERIIQHLQAIGDFYGYKPRLGTLLAAGN
jgi:hypothetical protein